MLESAAWLNLGSHYLERGDYKMAIPSFLRALDLSHSNDLDKTTQRAYQYLAVCFELTGALAKAIQFKERAYMMERHLFNENRIKSIDEMEIQYETEKTKRELSEETLLRARATFQKNIFIGLSLTAFILALFIYAYFRQKQQAARTIARQQEKIYQQQIGELLKTQELTAISAMLEGQEMERLRIARDLHDCLGNLLTTVKWSFDHYLESAGKNPETLEKASETLDEACHEVRRIAHNMVSGVLTNFGLVPALHELARTISASQKIQINILVNGMENRVDPKVEITIYRIIQELIGNILKHAKATKAVLQLTRLPGALNITLEDNGGGFDPRERKTGMGLKNVEARVQALHGELYIDSGQGNGTTIMVDLPAPFNQS